MFIQQALYTYFRNWRRDGIWVKIHDSLRECTRIEAERHPSPSEAIIDSQSVKSAAMVSQEVGYDAGKQIKGRKRFMTVDTLGLILRVLVTAANVSERSGGKQVIKRVKGMGSQVSRLTTIWTDGGFDGPAFMMWVMDICRWIVQVVLRLEQTKGFVLLKKLSRRRTHFRLADGVSSIAQHDDVGVIWSEIMNYYRKHQRLLFTLP